MTWSTSAERSEEKTSERQSHRDLHSFPTRRSSDLTGEVGSWNVPRFTGPVERVFVAAIERLNDVVYIGGDIFTPAGVSPPLEEAVAADANTGEILDWPTGFDRAVQTITSSGDAVNLGGIFTRVLGQQRLGFAALDTAISLHPPPPPPPPPSTQVSVAAARTKRTPAIAHRG